MENLKTGEDRQLEVQIGVVGILWVRCPSLAAFTDFTEMSAAVLEYRQNHGMKKTHVYKADDYMEPEVGNGNARYYTGSTISRGVLAFTPIYPYLPLL